MAASPEIEKGAYRGHGDVYRWLREHYESVAEWIVTKNPSGEAIAGRLAQAGILGVRGMPPTSRAVRKVWKRVCRDVQAEKERLEKEEARRLAKQREFVAGLRPATGSALVPAPMRPPIVEGGGSTGAGETFFTGQDGQPESSLARKQREIKDRLHRTRNPARDRFEKEDDDGMRE